MQEVDVLIRFTRTMRVRLWGRELQSADAGARQRDPLALAAVLMAQGCGEPVTQALVPVRADGRVA